MSDPDLNLNPPSAKAVARRAIALSAYCCRGYIENGKGNVDAESVRDRMIQWLTRLELIENLAPYEWDRIQSPLGSLRDGIAKRMTWEAGGLAVFAWALGCGNLPGHDERIDPYAVTDSLRFLGDDAKEIIDAAELRDSVHLHAYRELMYAIHCRLRDCIRQPGQKDFTRWIEMRWLDVPDIDARAVFICP